jgi:hypothetical protein
MKWTIINSKDRIVQCLTCPEEELKDNLRDGDWYVAGDFVNGNYEVTNGLVVEKDMTEQLRNEAIMRMRTFRGELLDEADTRYCNAERWTNMSAEMREAWSIYKNKLRDLPVYCDPFNPVWPIKPE